MYKRINRQLFAKHEYGRITLATMGLSLALVLLADAPVAQAQTSSLGYYEEARALFAKGEYPAAMIQLQNALKEDPEHVPARILTGRAYFLVGNGAAAEKEFRTARLKGADQALIMTPMVEALLLQRKYKEVLEELPTGEQPTEVESQILIARGSAYLGLKELDKAQTAFVRATEMRPFEAAPLLGRARVMIARSEEKTAEFLVDRALLLEPENGDASYMKGETRRLAGDLEAAIKHYDRALALDPRAIDVRISRAAMLIDVGRDADSLPDIEQVRTEFPNHAQAAYLHALVLARAGDVDGAEGAMRAAAGSVHSIGADAALSHGPTLLLSGVLRFRQRSIEAARDSLTRYMKIDPGHAGARKMLGIIMLQNSEPDRAIELLEPLLASHPDDAKLLVVLGTAYRQTGRHLLAIDLLGKASELAPEVSGIRTQLAQSRFAVGETEKAVKDLESAVAMEAGSAQAVYLLTLMHMRQGEFDAAVASVRKLVDREPDNPVSHDLAGMVYLSQGDLAAARASFEAALKLDPDYRSAQFNLARLDLRADDDEAARKRYLAVLSTSPQDTQAMLDLAGIAESRGRREEAIAWLDKARAADGASVGLRVLLVDHYLRVKQVSAAREVAEELASREVGNPVVLEALGRAEHAAGALEKARASFARMAETAQGSPVLLTRAAHYQSALGDLGAARVTLQQALMADAKHVPAQAALVLVQAKLGDISGALALASNVRQQDPEAAVGNIITGDALMQARRYAEAADAYAAALTQAATSDVVLRLFGARWQADMREPAIRSLVEWLEANADDAAARSALGSAYLQLGRFEAATRELELVLQSQPNDNEVLNNVAWLYQRAGDPRALILAEKAVSIDPQHVGSLDTLGWILVEGGDPVRGLGHLRDAHSRASNNPTVRYHLAVALNLVGKSDEALRELQQLLQSGQGFAEIQDARDLLLKLTSS